MPTSLNRFHSLLMSGLGLFALFYLSYWAGFPKEMKVPFLIGVTLFILFLAGYGWIGYHLLVRPLPAGHKNPTLNMLPTHYRRLLALFLGIGGMGVTVGGFWDEVWHRVFGLPFGEDLLWRPHLLIYMGLLTPPLLAIISLFRVMRLGKGTIQQKFRADPVLGFLVMVGLLLAVCEPLDPIWHTIYGGDISAWSLPHLILLVGVTLVMMLGAFVQLTTMDKNEWHGVWRASAGQWLIIFFFTFALTLQLQVLATDWESGNRMALSRPDWLLPAIFITLATFTGTLVNRTTRTYGAATMIGLLTIAIRWGLTQVFNYQVPLDGWLPIFGPLIGLDVWYAIRMLRNLKGDESWKSGLTAAIGMTLFALPLTNQIYPFLNLTGLNFALSALICLLAGIAGTWIGQAVADGLGNAPREVGDANQQTDRLRIAAPGLFVAAVVFMIFFIATAAPPV